MVNFNSNIWIAIIIVIIIISIIYLLNKNDIQPQSMNETLENYQNTNNCMKNNDFYNRIGNDILDELVSQQIDESPTIVSTSNSIMKPYQSRKNGNGSDSNPKEFLYKKKKFIKRTPEDVKDLFDVEKMLPQEIEEDWFDVEPLRTTKRIKGNLLHPKYLIGVDTIRSSKKNSTHDIRGDVPTPKIYVSPWNNSTIEPDNNFKGLCS